MGRWRSWMVAATAFVAGGTTTLGLQRPLRGAQDGVGRFWKDGAAASKEAPSTPSSPAQVLPSLSGLLKTVSPSVVYISTSRTVRMSRAMPFDFGPFGFGFPDRHPNIEQKSDALGSGFVISADGYIVTNNHVVADTDAIRVQLTDGREFDATIVGRDPQIDLALIKIDATGLPTVALGDSDRLEQGDWVVALGNSLGLDHTASLGIVSGTARNLGIGRYDALLQTDAAINPGNSGGPLFNLHGEVIGINTAIIGGANTIGFAIPINMAKDVLPDLKASGKAIRGKLGVLLAPIDPEDREVLKIGSHEGALVQRVEANSPAARAGLVPGDVIVALDGKPVKEVKDLQRRVAKSRPGSDVSIAYVRDGKKRTTTARVVEYDEGGRVARRPSDESDEEGSERLGIAVSDLTPEVAHRYRLKADEGVVIRRVERGSIGDELGLEEGDRILEANRRRVANAKQFEEIARETAGRRLLLLIERDGETMFLVAPGRRSIGRRVR